MIQHRCAVSKGASGAPVLLTRSEYAGYVVGLYLGRIPGSNVAVACTTAMTVPRLLQFRTRYSAPS